MEVAQEELLETFEEFELDLEVETILEKVKRELTLEDQTFREFAETVEPVGAGKSRGPETPGSTSRPLPPAVLPSTHL